MKKIVITGTPLCGTITGIPRYMYEILTRLDRIMEDDKIEIEILYPSELNFVDYDFHKIKIIPLERKRKRWLPQIVIPYINENGGILCDMADGKCIFKGEIYKLDDVRPVVRKYDTKKNIILFWINVILIRRNASVVVTVSPSQKIQIQKLIPNKKVIMIPNAWDHMHSFKSDNRIFEKNDKIRKGEYYYSVGSIAKHKNYRWIYEVARRNPTKQFVVAGNEDLKKWKCDSSGLKNDNIIFTGYISNEENRALYENCRAFLHPAFYEGFGIPPLEAFSFGKNIAVSDIPEFHNTYGDKVSYFNPYDYEFNLDLIKNVSQEDRGVILNKYLWDESAKLWRDLFLEI